MMYFLDDQGVIDILKALFSTLWSGLDDVFVPGFDFSFAVHFPVASQERVCWQ